MSTRRPRNIISRNLKLSLRAADLLDEGLSDQKVADILTEEFGKAVKRKAVFAFRNGTYKEIQGERKERSDAAHEVQLIIGAANESGAAFAKAGTDLLAKMLYDLLKQRANVNPVAVGKTLAKIREIENDTLKLKLLQERETAARQAASVAGDEKIKPEDRQAKIKELFGLK